MEKTGKFLVNKIGTFEDLIGFVKRFRDWPQRLAVAYIRVSTKEQAQEGFSLEAQERYLTKYCAAILIPYIFFFTEYETAKCKGRREFNKMIGFIRSHAGKDSGLNVLVEKTDRITRNDYDAYNIRSAVEENGVLVHYVKENSIQSSSSKAAEKFLQRIRFAVSALGSDNLSEEASKGMSEKAKQGMYPSCAPIGYVNVKNENKKNIIIPDPQRAPIIKKIFELYVYEGRSVRDIHSYVKSIGFTSPRSRKIVSRNTISDILKREMYTGNFTWKNEKYEGIYEPIVSKELFAEAQEIQWKKAPYSSETPHRKGDYTFTRILTCGYCGYAIVGEVKKGKYLYYHCTGNGDPSCPNKKQYTRSEIIEGQALASLEAIKINKEILPWVIDALKEENAKEREVCESSIRSLQERSSRNEFKLSKLLDLLLERQIDDNVYKQQRERILCDQKEIQDDIKRLQSINPSVLENGARLLELVQESVILYKNQIPSEKRKLLKIVHSNLDLKGNELVAEYRKPFDILAGINKQNQRKKAVSKTGNGLRSNWLPGQDSNLRQGG